MIRIIENILDSLKRAYIWTYITIHTIIINISIALFNTEQEILKADPNDLQERDKNETRMRSRNQTLEKFYAGTTDEKYVKDYYEVLKKADKFMRTATPYQMAVAADKHAKSYGQELEAGGGVRYEHFGFYDPKHKHAGKTLQEVLIKEYEERRMKDDDYEILAIFNNKPIEVGLVKAFDLIKKSDKEEDKFEVMDMIEKSKTFEFPIKVVRDDETCQNKIEQLSEFLHVKKIGFEYRQLEFFIPLKFKSVEITEDSEIFKELINIKEVYLRSTYGELIGFGIIKYFKRITYNDTHEVLKFEAIEMQNMGINT